jgi:hypothetical protein
MWRSGKLKKQTLSAQVVASEAAPRLVGAMVSSVRALGQVKRLSLASGAHSDTDWIYWMK